MITGSSRMNGLLNIRLRDGFVPNIGHSFEILSYASKYGDFCCINGLALPGTGRRLQPVYTASSLILVTVPSEEAPVLQVGHQGKMLSLCWDTNYPGFDLQTVSNLLVLDWVTLPHPGSNVMFVTPDEPQRYYRMIKP